MSPQPPPKKPNTGRPQPVQGQVKKNPTGKTTPQKTQSPAPKKIAATGPIKQPRGEKKPFVLKIGKYELPGVASALYGASIAIIIVSIILGIIGFKKFMTKRNLTSALEAYHTNQLIAATTLAEKAVLSNPDQHNARMLWATLLAQTGAYDRAREQYNQLITAGYMPAYAYVGLGVIELRRADSLTGTDAVAACENARKYFESAKGIDPTCFEAISGLGICSLVSAKKQGLDKNMKLVQQAMADLKKAEDMLSSPEARAKISRSGLVDFYAAYGNARRITSRTYSDVVSAAQYYQKAFAFNPNSDIYLSNCLRARTHALNVVSSKEYVAHSADIESFIAYMEKFLYDSKRKDMYPNAMNVWSTFLLGTAVHFAEEGKRETAIQMIDKIPYEMRTSAEYWYAAATASSAMADPNKFLGRWKEPVFLQAASDALGKVSAFVNNQVVYSSFSDEIRAISKNNEKIFLYFTDQYGVDRALAQLELDLKELCETYKDKKYYFLPRNMAVVLTIRGKRDDAKPYLEQASSIAAASTDVTVREDIEKTRKFVEGQ